MKKLQLLSALAIVPMMFACDKNDEDPMDPMDPTTKTLTLNIDNLADVGDDATYEGWIVVNGAPISTGTFDVDADGNLSQSTFTVAIADLDAATDFVLSIEPVPDTDEAPSAIKIMGGSFSGSDAEVSTDHGAALGDDFSSSMGNYILATPTTIDMTDENSGLWFLHIGSGGPEVGLDLPTLPAGWKYEGWAVIDGSPISSGTFSAVDTEDDSALYSGSDDDGPPFPGEDYVANAPSGSSFPTDLAGGVAVISIEPFPDNDPAPFQLKPLVGMIDVSATDHTNYTMDNMTTGFPSGTVSR